MKHLGYWLIALHVFMQEAFFGKQIVDKSKTDLAATLEATSDEEKPVIGPVIKSTLDSKDPFEFPDSPVKEPSSQTAQGQQKMAASLPQLQQQRAAVAAQMSEDSDKEHPMGMWRQTPQELCSLFSSDPLEGILHGQANVFSEDLKNLQDLFLPNDLITQDDDLLQRILADDLPVKDPAGWLP